MIKYQTYNLNNLILSSQVLESYLTKFWSDIFVSYKDNKHLMILCKVESKDSEGLSYKTLGHLRRVNFTDKELFLEYLNERLGLFYESYSPSDFSKITFSYIIKDGLASGHRTLLQDFNNKEITTHRFNNLNLPISMNPTDFGEVIATTVFGSFTRYIVSANTRLFKLDVSMDGLTNNVKILGAIDLSWNDTKINDVLFTREIGKSTIYFMDGVRVLTKKLINAKPFKKLTADSKIETNFVTMDIETIKLNNKITPYLVCAYNGTDYITSYTSPTNPQVAGNISVSIDQIALFKNFILKLLSFFSKGNKTLIVYAHNFSGFDGIFLLKHLLSYGNVKPLIHNGKLMSIKINLNIEGYKGKTIIFKDSMLLLPLSLRKLCKAFNIAVPKGIFPFNLTNIFYTGILPKFEYWTGITLSEYGLIKANYKGKIWNFKDEAIKYCKIDCQSLHEILIKFNELILKE